MDIQSSHRHRIGLKLELVARVLAATAPVAVLGAATELEAQDPARYKETYLKENRHYADQNRYMVKPLVDPRQGAPAVHHGVLSPPMYGDPGGITPLSKPLPRLLKDQGYRTAGVGKWHLGEGLKNLPTVLGYDEYYGFLNVSDMYSEWRDHHYNPEVVWDEERERFMQNVGFNHYLIYSRAATEAGEPVPAAEQCKSLKESSCRPRRRSKACPPRATTNPATRPPGTAG